MRSNQLKRFRWWPFLDLAASQRTGSEEVAAKVQKLPVPIARSPILAEDIDSTVALQQRLVI